VRDGVLQLDRRAFVYHMGLGNSPAMMAKNVGAGSQYLWTYEDADGSVDILFGPEMPQGRERNWIRTVPGRGWFPISLATGRRAAPHGSPDAAPRRSLAVSRQPIRHDASTGWRTFAEPSPGYA
jgi:hypothetical protein